MGDKRKQVPVIRYKTGMQGDSGARLRAPPRMETAQVFIPVPLFSFLGREIVRRAFHIEKVLRRTGKFILYAKVSVRSSCCAIPKRRGKISSRIL